MPEQTFSCILPVRLCHMTLRHSQPRHPVQRSTTDEQFSGLTGKRTRAQPIRKERLEPKHARLGQTAPMIARLHFPLLASDFADGAQVLVAIQTRRLRVAMLPDARPLRGGITALAPLLRIALVTVSGVISPVSAHLFERGGRLIQKLGQDLAIGKVVGGYHRGHNSAGCRRRCPDAVCARCAVCCSHAGALSIRLRQTP